MNSKNSVRKIIFKTKNKQTNKKKNIHSVAILIKNKIKEVRFYRVTTVTNERLFIRAASLIARRRRLTRRLYHNEEPTSNPRGVRGESNMVNNSHFD